MTLAIYYRDAYRRLDFLSFLYYRTDKGAALNGPQQTVVSGPGAAIDRVIDLYVETPRREPAPPHITAAIKASPKTGL